jgi:hypothetical protein
MADHLWLLDPMLRIANKVNLVTADDIRASVPLKSMIVQLGVSYGYMGEAQKAKKEQATHSYYMSR